MMSTSLGGLRTWVPIRLQSMWHRSVNSNLQPEHCCQDHLLNESVQSLANSFHPSPELRIWTSEKEGDPLSCEPHLMLGVDDGLSHLVDRMCPNIIPALLLMLPEILSNFYSPDFFLVKCISSLWCRGWQKSSEVRVLRVRHRWTSLKSSHAS